jgi:hypothetical protein
MISASQAKHEELFPKRGLSVSIQPEIPSNHFHQGCVKAQ